MMLDAQTNFAPPNSAISMVGADGVTIQIGVTIDLLGQGVGTAPAGIIGNTTLWGVDPGIGRVRPGILIAIGTAFTTGNSATAQFALEYAADQGAGGSYQPSTWYISSATQAHAASVMSAGQQIRMDVTPAPPEVPAPRYVRLVMIPAASTHFTAGTVTFAGLTMVRDDLTNLNQANNYVVS